MKKIFTILLLSFIFLNVKAQPVFQTIDSVMLRLYPADAPGAALLIEKDGKIIIEKGYGLADLKTKRPVTPSTDFRMASVSKQFTAMCVMLLAEKNKLILNDPISAFLSQLPPDLQSITIRQLLTHTSGMWDYEPLIPDSQSTQVLDEDVLQLIRQKDSTYFAPGTRFRYSNTGYCLLALIVQKVSGIPYADFVEKNIFLPLKMDHSLVYIPGENIPERAYGYHWKNGVYHYADQSVTSATKGDGGVYTSLIDYVKWNRALDADQLLPEVLMDSIFTGRVKVKNGIQYGYGWFIGKEKDNTQCLFHSGESTGFHNIVYKNPKKHLLVILFSNRDDDTIAGAFDSIAGLTGIKIDFRKKNATEGPSSLFHWLSSVYGD